VITLAVASMFMAGWIRSLNVEDVFSSYTANHNDLLFSSEGVLAWTRISENRAQGAIPLPKWETNHDSDRWLIPSNPKIEWDWKWNGFGMSGPYMQRSACRMIPYWSIVLPLTAISAWLLLSKPRAKVEPPITSVSEDA
jgi:hypothetical protein